MNYDGEHEIYKRGFLKAEQRYFTYADGTPFFYLGDTHWHMALEEIDTKEEFEDGTVASRFEYTLMRRKELGFTVIQSEPLGVYDGDNSYFKRIFTEKFGEEQLARFQQYDKYFKLIAERGFVHANAQFSYPTALGDAMHLISDEDLARLCRYWGRPVQRVSRSLDVIPGMRQRLLLRDDGTVYFYRRNESLEKGRRIYACL